MTTDKPTWRNLSPRARLLIATTNLVVLLGCLEMASRVYWKAVHNVPPFATGKIWEKNFPHFAQVYEQTRPENSTPGTCEALVLGPSVWAASCGDLKERFERGLSEKLGRPVRVSNLSVPGHTSRDALLQYRRLADRKFDLVLVYHGINDVFLNNIPEPLYREDYSHASRYRHIDALAEHPEHPYFVLPYTVRYLVCRWQEQLRLRRQPGRDFLAEGETVRTGPAFERHLRELIDLARERGESVVLVTTPIYIPANYTDEAFEAKTLDYVRYLSILRTWGTTTSVPRAIGIHNDVVRKVALENSPHVALADVATTMPAEGRFFDDCCHFSTAGCERFTELLMGAVDWTTRIGRREP